MNTSGNTKQAYMYVGGNKPAQTFNQFCIEAFMNSQTRTDPLWLSPKDTSETKNWPIGGIRHLIFHAETNGFKKCIRRIGTKILINQELFDKWIEEQGAIK